MIITYLKDRATKRLKQRTTENLLGFVTHRQCLEALERALSEPLDRPEFADMTEEQRARIRESF